MSEGVAPAAVAVAPVLQHRDPLTRRMNDDAANLYIDDDDVPVILCCSTTQK